MDTLANVLFVAIIVGIIWIILSNKFGKETPVYLEIPANGSADNNYDYHDPSWDNKPNVGNAGNKRTTDGVRFFGRGWTDLDHLGDQYANKPAQSGTGRTLIPVTSTGRPSARGGDNATSRVAGAMNRLEEITGRSVQSVEHYRSKQDFIFTDGHGLSNDVVSIAGTPCQIIDDKTIRIKT